MLLETDVDLEQIKFECSKCRSALSLDEKPRLTVLIDPCKVCLDENHE